MCKVFAFLLIPAVNAFFSVVPTVRPALSTSLGAFGVTASISVKEDKKNIIPGIIHIDNSCRIQSVDKDIPHFYDLLKEFKSITNVSVLLNTSFNMAGEALVESLEDAINTFNKTKIDILWFPEIGKMIKK